MKSIVVEDYVTSKKKIKATQKISILLFTKVIGSVYLAPRDGLLTVLLFCTQFPSIFGLKDVTLGCVMNFSVQDGEFL